VHQVVVTREVEKVAESRQALVALAAHHHVAVDHAKVGLAVGPFVSQMLVVAHLLPKVSVENRLKDVRQFVNY
jgi:hypothetical protein